MLNIVATLHAHKWGRMKGPIVMAAVLAMLGALSGCEGVAHRLLAFGSVQDVTLVLPPGYAISMGGEPAQVFGRDACPSENGTMQAVFGVSHLAGSTDCVNIAPHRMHVDVRILQERRLMDETWRVERIGSRLSLYRPNGDAVASYSPR